MTATKWTEKAQAASNGTIGGLTDRVAAALEAAFREGANDDLSLIDRAAAGADRARIAVLEAQLAEAREERAAMADLYNAKSDAARAALAESEAGNAKLRRVLEQALAELCTWRSDGHEPAMVQWVIDHGRAALATPAGRDALEEMKALRAAAEVLRDIVDTHLLDGMLAEDAARRVLAALRPGGEPPAGGGT